MQANSKQDRCGSLQLMDISESMWMDVQMPNIATICNLGVMNIGKIIGEGMYM